MLQLFESLYFEGELVFEKGISFFIAQIDNFDCYFFFSYLVNTLEDIAFFSKIYMIIETVRVILYFFS